MSEAKVPAHLRPYVEVLGEVGAIEFLLAFGGSAIYLTRRPHGRSNVQDVIGRENVVALAGRFGDGELRVPVGKYWIVQRMYASGETVMGIARTMHITEPTARRWLKKNASKAMPSRAKKDDGRQSDLFAAKL